MVSDDLNSSGNVSNWELGRDFVRDRKFDDANRCFLAEVTHSGSTNTLVYNDHGHLLNMMGRYEDAIVKFNSYLSSHRDNPSSLFGKGISFIGLNRLDEAIDKFKRVLEKTKDKHAAAWYYSAIIYANPFYHDYNPSYAKECYEKYLNSREEYLDNLDYFNEPFDGLSLEKVHDYYKVSDLFRRIDQLLESGNVDLVDNVLKDYGILYCFKEDLGRLFDIFKLFDEDVYLDDVIKEFNSKKNIEVKFEFAGFDDGLIRDLSSRFGGLSIEDKMVLVELMDYFKGSRLSLTDINDLIREYVFEEEMSLDSIYEYKGYVVNDRLEKNASMLTKPIKEELSNKVAENDRLRSKNEKLENKIESLSEENKDSKQKFQNKKRVVKNRSNQPSSAFEYNKLRKEMESSIENLCDELINKMESCLRDDYKDASSKNILSGFMNLDYEKDLKVLEGKYGISKDVLNTLELAFKNFTDGNFEKASDLFSDTNLIEAFHTDELQEYRGFLEATSLSREGEVEEAYEMIESKINMEIEKAKKEVKAKAKKENNTIDKGLTIEINPIRWFNFGNICFDYANSQSVKDISYEHYDLAYNCYDCAMESFRLHIFKFGDKKPNGEKSDEENKFINDVSQMVSNKKVSSKKIYDHLNNIKKFKKGAVITKKLSYLNKLQGQIFHDLEEIKNLKQK